MFFLVSTLLFIAPQSSSAQMYFAHLNCYQILFVYRTKLTTVTVGKQSQFLNSNVKVAFIFRVSHSEIITSKVKKDAQTQLRQCHQTFVATNGHSKLEIRCAKRMERMEMINTRKLSE